MTILVGILWQTSAIIGFQLFIFFTKLMNLIKNPKFKAIFWLFLSNYWQGLFLTILGGIFTPNICILRSQSFIFFIKSMILSKNPKLRHTLPLFLGGSQNHGSPLKTNKQTIFFKFNISQSFPLWYPIFHANMNKIHHCKHLKTMHFCFSYLSDVPYSIGLK